MSSYTAISTITPVPALNSRRAEMLQQALNDRHDEFTAAAFHIGPRAEELRHHEQVLADERDALLAPGECQISQKQLSRIVWQLVQLGVFNSGVLDDLDTTSSSFTDLDHEAQIKLRAAHGSSTAPTIPARKFYDLGRIITVEEIEASLKVWDSISAQTRPTSREMRRLWSVLTYGLEHDGCHVIPEIQFTS